MSEPLKNLIDANFMEYASYVIKERAIPHINDGLKPVQRRILHTMLEMDDGKFNKVANIVGRCMQYHPHGDASIFAALVVLANKELFIDKQGNFGNIYTGDSASAARYIEARLTPMAKEVMFNKDITEFIDSYDGRNKEPVTLPAKIPTLILQGADGIAVGMSTTILPHNFKEVLEAQIKILKEQPFELFPDFPTGGLMDASEYKDGNGKVKVRARIEKRDDKHLIIKEIPYGTTTEKLITSIENAIKKNRIKASAIQDYTAEEVEIELTLSRGVYAEQVEDALFAFTDCEISHSVQGVVIGPDDKPQIMSISDMLRYNTAKLKEDLRREYEIELGRLNDQLHYKTLEQIFIEERIYKNIEEEGTYEGVIKAVYRGFEPYTDRLIRPIEDDDVERLLQIKIKRISKFDIEKSRKEINAILARIDEVNVFLSNMTKTTIGYINGLLKKYGKDCERKTKIANLSDLAPVEEIAVQDQKLGFDKRTGFVGTEVKSVQYIQCSKFHKILIFTDKYYKVIPVPDKLFIKEKIIHIEKLDKDQIFNCMYREQTSGIAYMKRFKVEKFILEKEYPYTLENAKILLLQPDPPPLVKVFFPMASKVRKTEEEVDYSEQLVKGAAARGNRVSPKPVVDIEILPRPNSGGNQSGEESGEDDEPAETGDDAT